MARIVRDPAKAASEQYDLIIIGGGIYGVMLAFESSRRGLLPLLLERDDFGQHTSFNSLRIIHGGLRYLQSFDLHRFRESVNERKWFLKTFPHLVKPLPCLMPLYENNLKRPSILRVALRVNDLLSYYRNRGMRKDRQIPPGQVIDANRTMAIFPMVDPHGLKGSAIWYDAYMPDSQRLLIEILRWACKLGATVLNYVEASDLIKNRKEIVGIKAFDRESRKVHKYQSNTVVNTSGPWSRDIAARYHKDLPKLFKPSVAWNILFNRAPLSTHALAVTPKLRGGRTYFLVPWKGKMLAGTSHSSWLKNDMKEPKPTTDQILWFLNDLNLAIPKLNLQLDDILHIFSGLLPVKRNGGVNLTTREVILNHKIHGGPHGLYSISGVKWTTSRLVAEKALNKIFPEKKLNDVDHHIIPNLYKGIKRRRVFSDFNQELIQKDENWMRKLKLIVEEESVMHLDDLIFRRTSLWEDREIVINIAPLICKAFHWNIYRCSKEIDILKKGTYNRSG